MTVPKINDERIQKNLDKNAASVYPVLLILTTIVLIMKITLNLHPFLYLFEIIALVASLSYYTLSTAWGNVLFVKGTDEAIINIRNTAKGKSYMLHALIVFGGQILFVGIVNYFYPWVPEAQMSFAFFGMLIYIFICGLPLSIVGYKMRKKEPLVMWNSEESKTRVLKNFKHTLITQTISTGVIGATLYLFTSTSLITTIVTYGIIQFICIFMYLEIKRNLLRDEKRAKEAGQAEKTADKVDGYEE
ncbi:MAG: hypothetical protein LBI79_02685 [Nitrososphaerota archaeon]|jgi:hypothetical protein|nr:hypothetical protein [Nitrososphaerota archaeon]